MMRMNLKKEEEVDEGMMHIKIMRRNRKTGKSKTSMDGSKIDVKINILAYDGLINAKNLDN